MVPSREEMVLIVKMSIEIISGDTDRNTGDTKILFGDREIIY